MIAAETPGQAFVRQHGVPRGVSELRTYVERYACFLRAGVEGVVPVPLEAIIEGWAFRVSRVPPEVTSEGFVVEERRLIVVRDEGYEPRVRFTMAHELMETLCTAVRRSAQTPEAVRHALASTSKAKERLCDVGAACLLLPTDPFRQALRDVTDDLMGVRDVSRRFGCSFAATLLRFVEAAPGSHALVWWTLRHKPEEVRRMSGGLQLGLGFGEGQALTPPKRMRVDYVRTSADGERRHFIPLHKSSPEHSIVHGVAQTGRSSWGFEHVDMNRWTGTCFVEALPQAGGEGAGVLSLIHLPDDAACAAQARRAHPASAGPAPHPLGW